MPCHICWPSQKYVKDHFINCNTLNSFFSIHPSYAYLGSSQKLIACHSNEVSYHWQIASKCKSKSDIISEWHFQPKWYLISWTFFTSRIEARKAWLASVSTVFHYATLYWTDLGIEFHNNILQWTFLLHKLTLKKQNFNKNLTKNLQPIWRLREMYISDSVLHQT